MVAVARFDHYMSRAAPLPRFTNILIKKDFNSYPKIDRNVKIIALFKNIFLTIVGYCTKKLKI